MKMKKSVILAVGTVLLCSVLCAGCGRGNNRDKIAEADCSGYETIEFHTIILPEGAESFTIRPDGTMLGGGSGGKTYQYNSDGTKNTVVDSSSSRAFFCTDGEDIYAYDYEKSAVVELIGLGEDMRVIEDTLSVQTIRSMVALDGKIYVLAIPYNEESSETFFAFGAQEFEDFGEEVYCIDAESGEVHTLDLEHITAEYRSEDGRLFFYGWQEEKYYLYEYDTEKEKIAGQLFFASMGNLLNIVVEGGYLFGISPADGLISIDLTDGEKMVWSKDVYAMYGNDLQFYRGNLFANNMAMQEIQQVLAVNTEGDIIEISGNSGTLSADGTSGNKNGQNGTKNEGSTEVEGENAKWTENDPQPTKWPQRTETITVSSNRYGELDASAIKRISGMKTKMADQPFDLDALVTELMAGNPDVDIYIFTAGWPVTQRIRELGLYEPLNGSKIISEDLGRCFDYIQAAATNDNGDIWMLPLYEYCDVTWYIPENMQKFGIEPEELSMLEGYIEVLKRLQGKTGANRYYNKASVFWDGCDILYDVNYNNYETGEINFDTELYRKLAAFFWPDWDRYSSAQANHPLFYSVNQELGGEAWTAARAPEFDKDAVIFKTTRVDEHLNKIPDISLEEWKGLLEGWRVLPFPKLQSDAEQGVVYLYYACVNPYSRQKEAATAYLEVLAENRNETVGIPSFLYADLECYKGRYDTSAPAFEDLYEIFWNSAVFYRHSWDLYDTYITDYQRGLISFDEAIERRQKRAVTGLYE